MSAEPATELPIVVENEGDETNLTPEEKATKLKEQLANGRRYMRTFEFSKAADSLGMASQLSGDLYGDEAVESFDAFFLYGQALLEVAKEEDQMFNEGKTDKNTEGSTSAAPLETVAEENEPVDNAEDEENEDEEDEIEDEESTLQLAWEILEASRNICDKVLETQLSTEELKRWNLNKADIYCCLGEHSIVDNKFEQAQNDLKLALELQEKYLAQSSRILAQTNHLLAKAYRADDRFAQAAAHFVKAKDVLKLKIAELTSQISTETDAEKQEELKEELKEIEELLPSMDAFIEDAKESIKQQEQFKEAMKSQFNEVFGALLKPGEKAPAANDISGQVRRKRPADGIENQNGNEAKKK